MSYVEGNDLRHHDSLPPERACEIVMSVLDTLEYCHSRDVIHRDLKPANIVIRSVDGLPVLVDFGLSVSIAAYVERISKSAPGTPGYMAPEFIADPTIRDVRLDIYSIGVVLYQLISGRLPNLLSLLTLRSFREDIDEALDEIIRSRLAPAETRIPSAKHLRERLVAWLDIHRERVAHAGKLSARGQAWRRNIMEAKRRRMNDERATAEVAAERVRIAGTQAAGLVTKTLLLFEEVVSSLQDQISELALKTTEGMRATPIFRVLESARQMATFLI